MTIEFKSEQSSLQDIKQMTQEENITPLGKFFSKLSGGLIKTQTQANQVFVVITVIAFAITIILLTKHFTG